MKKRIILLPFLFIALLGLLVWHPWRSDEAPPATAAETHTSLPDPPEPAEPIYESKPASRDGIGKDGGLRRAGRA